MSKSRNSKRRDYDDFGEVVQTKKEVRKIAARRKEKRLTTALKSRNLNILTQLEDDFE